MPKNNWMSTEQITWTITSMIHALSALAWPFAVVVVAAILKGGRRG